MNTARRSSSCHRRNIAHELSQTCYALVDKQGLCLSCAGASYYCSKYPLVIEHSYWTWPIYSWFSYSRWPFSSSQTVSLPEGKSHNKKWYRKRTSWSNDSFQEHKPFLVAIPVTRSSTQARSSVQNLSVIPFNPGCSILKNHQPTPTLIYQFYPHLKSYIPIVV